MSNYSIAIVLFIAYIIIVRYIPTIFSLEVINMSRERVFVDADDIVNRYVKGTSENALAELFHVDRNTIRRRLLGAGIKPRNRSEGMYLRMAQASPEERQRLSKAAHDAVRGLKRTEADLCKRAIGLQKTKGRIGAGEVCLKRWLENRGLDCTLQYAVNRYNIDIFCDGVYPLAVELHVSPCDPLAVSKTFNRAKVKYILNRHWNIIFVWVTKRHFLIERSADYITSHFEEIQSNPTIRSQYRVIRGSGELCPIGGNYID